MARRRKGEDVADWVPPTFDEVEFMRREIGAAKASVVSVVYAIPVALASYAMTVARLPGVVAFFAGLGLISLLYYLMPLIGIDTSKYKRKDWLGHGSIVFFSWLAFWILLLNPPFGDFTRPDISNVAVASAASPGAPALTCKSLFPGDNTPFSKGANSTLYVTFRVTDNVAIASVNATMGGALNLVNAGGSQNRCANGVHPPGTYEAFVPAPALGLVVLTIAIVDTAGNAYGLTFKFPMNP